MSIQWVTYVTKHSFFCMHTFSFTEHAIGASDVAASFDLQVNPEGQEGNPEVEVQQVRLEDLKKMLSAQTTSQPRSWKASPGAF